MKNLISILTATAASLVAVGVASAADLPSKKAAPAQYVKICDAFGAGFFYIPGSDTCLKIGGYVRAEYRLRTNPLPKDNETFFRARGLVALDARTKTSYGDLRTFVQLRITEDTAQASAASFLPNAFIEFAGITAGRRVNSFFDFYAHDYEWIGVTTSSDQAADVLAYTAKFGSGFSATLSLENAAWRMQGGNGALALGSVAPAAQIGYTANGSRMPEVVGVLRAEGTWGSAQLSGALHQINAALPTVNVSKIGYAVQAGAKINLPMLAAGDTVMVQVAYSNGATEYVNSNDIGSVWAKSAHIGIGDQSALATSATTVGLVQSYGITAGFEHNWTSTLKSAVFGSYSVVKNPGAAITLGFYDEKIAIVGTRLVWSPVKDLVIGPEVTYENVKLKQISAVTSALPAVSNGSDIRAAFRIQKAF